VFVESPGIRAWGALSGSAAEAVFAGASRTLQSVREEADKKGGRPGGFKLKTRVTIRSTATWERVSSPNVIGILPGADPELAEQYIVLSAHLDHLGIKVPAGDGDDEDHIFNGALDNAAGVATLLEVARAAMTASDRPRRSMMFIATTAEEKRSLGADYFARHPTVPIGQIVGNVNLDSPLLLYRFTDVIAFGANHSTIGPMVEAAIAPMNVKLSPDPMPEQGLFTRADHYMLVRQGVPAVVLATGFANGGEEFWGEFWSDVYHGPKDDVTQKIDWHSAARFAEVNYRIARAMADSDQRPLWFVDDYFGDAFAPDAPRAPR
jgi:Zn-dependent M28 family amino/carboxypeptidase